MVVLPAPVVPTSATVCPAGTVRFRSGSTGAPGDVGEVARRGSATSPRTEASFTGCSGSLMPGRSASTPASFSSADDADWKVLKNCEISCIGSKNIRRYSRNAVSVPIVICPCSTR